MATIDPNVAPLNKEIKTLRSQFKKALSKVSAARAMERLNCIFGSSCESRWIEDNNLNTQEQLSWTCLLPTSTFGASFRVHAELEVNDRNEVVDVQMADRWIYEAYLPLTLVVPLHDAWAKQLTHAVQLLKENNPALSVFNWWDETTLLDALGWKMQENETGAMEAFPINHEQAQVACATMRALSMEPQSAQLHWPNVAPWLHAMQALIPAPPLDEPVTDIEAWQAWSEQLKHVHLRPEQISLELPPGAFDVEQISHSSGV